MAEKPGDLRVSGRRNYPRRFGKIVSVILAVRGTFTVSSDAQVAPEHPEGAPIVPEVDGLLGGAVRPPEEEPGPGFGSLLPFCYQSTPYQEQPEATTRSRKLRSLLFLGGPGSSWLPAGDNS
jgi:hypothetical protein